MSGLTFLLVGLACGRATRLVVNDAFPFGRFRAWLTDRYEDTWLQKMLVCPWCFSGWLSLAAVGILDHLGSLPIPVASWGAVWWLSVTSYWITETLAKYGVPDEPEPPSGVPPGTFS